MHRCDQSRDRGTLARGTAGHPDPYQALTRRWRGLVCAAAIALASCTAPAPPPGGVGGPDARAALAAVNAVRMAKGAPPMRLDPRLSAAMDASGGRALPEGMSRAHLLESGYGARGVLSGVVTGSRPVGARAAMATAMKGASTGMINGVPDMRLAPTALDFGVARHDGGRRWAYVFAEPIESLNPDVLDGLLREVNRARAQAGAQTLRRSPLLDQAATRHAADMATGQFLAHEGSDGSFASDRAAQAGYVWRSIAENLAETVDAAPQAVVSLWDGSPGHRRNMLNPMFREAGLAVREAATGDPSRPFRRWWVMVYGLRSGAG